MAKNKEINKQLLEDITKQEVRSIIDSKLREDEFEKKIKKITSEVISDLFKSLWNKKSFWASEVTR